MVVGVIVGSIIGLGAMGLTLSYGVLKFANFGHGDLMTLGMFLAFLIVGNLGWRGSNVGALSFGWGLFPAMLFAMAASPSSPWRSTESCTDRCASVAAASSPWLSPRWASG